MSKRFKTEQQTERVNLNEQIEVAEVQIQEENVLVSAGETVLMQTAMSGVKNAEGTKSEKTQISV